MKKYSLILIVLVIILAVVGCGNTKLSGKYKAVNPPVENGKMAIKEITFEGDEVILVSGDVSQKVKYKVAGEKLYLTTKFGDFSYEFKQDGDTLNIDGITYKK